MKEDDIWFYPNDFKLRIFLSELKEFTDKSIVFDGKFRIEKKLLPIRQFMYVRNEETNTFDCHLISIDSKEVVEDTSSSFYDEDVGGYVCLSSSELIRFNYTILYTFNAGDENDEKYHKEVCDEIVKEIETLIIKNEAFRDERERQENEEAMRSYVAPKL
jgi:hypothetical protein